MVFSWLGHRFRDSRRGSALQYPCHQSNGRTRRRWATSGHRVGRVSAVTAAPVPVSAGVHDRPLRVDRPVCLRGWRLRSRLDRGARRQGRGPVCDFPSTSCPRSSSSSGRAAVHQLEPVAERVVDADAVVALERLILHHRVAARASSPIRASNPRTSRPGYALRTGRKSGPGRPDCSCAVTVPRDPERGDFCRDWSSRRRAVRAERTRRAVASPTTDGSALRAGRHPDRSARPHPVGLSRSTSSRSVPSSRRSSAV
jgi:hypothetical protein